MRTLNQTKKLTMKFLIIISVITLLSLPTAFAQVKAGVIFHNDFETDSDVPLNQSVGTITEYENGGGIVSQINSTLRINDSNNLFENGFRVQYTSEITESFWVAMTSNTESSGTGAGSIGVGNCTNHMGLEDVGTCPTGGQEVWDNNFLKFTLGFAKIYSNTNSLCAFTNFMYFDYRLLHNFTDNTATLYQDGVFCGSKTVNAGEEMASSTGLIMQSGGNPEQGIYNYRDLCVYPDSLGNETFDCISANNAPVVIIDSPPDDSRVNNLTVVYTPTDLDLENMNCSVFMNTSGSLTLNVTNLNISNGTQTSVPISASDGDYSYLVMCDDGIDFTNTSVRTVQIDSTPPFFVSATPQNGTFDWRENPTFNFSGTYSDIGGMFNVSFTLFAPNGTIVHSAHNDTLLNISELALHTELNITNFVNGDYTAFFNGTDPHTQRRIPNYRPSKNADLKRLTYFPPGTEGQEISITLLSSPYPVVSFGDTKAADRHSFDYQVNIPLPEQGQDYTYAFELRSKYPITLFDPEHAHFIIWNSLNWVTFDLAGTGSETFAYREMGYDYDTDDYVWEIDISTDLNDLTFNSLGGLNVGSETYTYTFLSVPPSEPPPPLPLENIASIVGVIFLLVLIVSLFLGKLKGGGR